MSYFDSFIDAKYIIERSFRENSTMQISRHWRMNSQRYRLEGVRYPNGEVSIQARPHPPSKSLLSTEGGDLKNPRNQEPIMQEEATENRILESAAD